MNRELLMQYVDILNRMENVPYDVRMSRNDLDYSIIDYVEKKAADDLELQELIKEIKSLPSDERANFVKNYVENYEEKKAENAKNEEEEISKVFGVDVKDIQHLFLANGSEIFYFYESRLGRNIVLENSKKGKSLTEQLKAIQEESEKYQTENDHDNAHEILTDEALKSNMELEFYSKSEVLDHKAELENLSAEDISKVKYLINHYDELNIKGINIQNMIYIDQSGDIFEITYVDNKVNIAKPDSQDYSFEKTNINTDSNNSELDNMLNDNEESDTLENESDKNEENEENEELKEEEKEKPKVYVKNDNAESGFTNNALYFFIAGLILIIIIVILFVFFS